MRDVAVLGVTLNRYEADSVAARTTPDVLHRMCSSAVWTLPESPLSDRAAHEELVGDMPTTVQQMGEEPPL